MAKKTFSPAIAKIEANEQRFKNIFVSADVGIAEVSIQGDFIIANDSFSQLVGYAVEEIQTFSFARLTHPDDIDASWINIHRLLNGQAASYRMEKRYLHKNGTVIWVNLTVSLVRDTDGTPLYLIGVLIDITQQKLMEQQLKKLSQAVEQSPVSVVITNTNGTIEYVNPIFSIVTGYSKEEVLGQNPRILKSGNFPREFYQNMWQTILRGEIWRGEFINKRKNGESYWENASISPIFNNSGEITHLVAVKEDITLRKEMEVKLINARKAAEEANHAKSIFLANMSHEIRTPLNAILGFAQILNSHSSLTTEEKEKVSIINKSGEHLLSLINNILEISKIEAGKVTITPAFFDFGDMLLDLRDLFSLTIQEKGLAFHVFTAKDVPQYIKADQGKLKQILINLINNAIKFTDQGQIELQVKMEKTDCQNILLHFSVTDTGIGIAPENLEKIFNYFEQGVTHNKGGTGIGLALTKNLIALMGGKISVTSQPGKGSEFIFSLPAGITTQAPSTANTSHNYTESSCLSGPDTGKDRQAEISAALNRLSKETKDNLRDASVNGDIEYLEKFVAKISGQYPLVAQYLHKLLNEFDFEKLNKLFE